MASQTTEMPPLLNALLRAPLAGEFVPKDFFKRLERSDISRDDRPLEVDLGCGDGSFLLEMAAEFPERDFLGVERLLGRVKKVCKKATRAKLENLRVLRLESNYVVEWLLPEASVSRLHLLCPDPWPKLRHHPRRLVQQKFVDDVRRALIPGGDFLFMTDHEEYFTWTQNILNQSLGWEISPWQEIDFFYPKTDFQLWWESNGKPMFRLRATKTAP